jgi:DNA-binding MarR family transcriptional regulator
MKTVKGKTAKQIADEVGINKQRVTRYIKANHFKPHREPLQKGEAMYYDDTVEKQIKAHFSKNTASGEPHCEPLRTTLQPTSSDTVIDTVISMLKEELDTKNRQIDDLQKQLSEERQHSREQSNKILTLTERSQELTDNAQKLQAMENEKMQLTDGKKKSFFSKLFKKGEIE